METNKLVLKIYRRMLYTLMEVFEGDYESFHKMRILIRREVEKNKDNNIATIKQKILDFEEARKIISTSLIQGKLQNQEFYRYKVRPDLLLGMNTNVKDSKDVISEISLDDIYKSNIH